MPQKDGTQRVHPTRTSLLTARVPDYSFQLPVELLRAIFEEYLRLDCPIQVLLEVNRKWRTVALETRSLWRRILLMADAIPDSLRAGSVHACASERQARRILNRSGIITRLEVTFVLGPQDGDTPTPETRASLFKTVGHTALHRISFIAIIINPEMNLPLVTASFKDVFRGSLPSLESLMIASAEAIGNLYDPLGALMDIIEKSSTRLKSLYLENVKDFILHASRKTFWTRLVRITIRKEFDSLDASLFSLFPALEFLSFTGELVAAPAPSPPPDLEFLSFTGELLASPEPQTDHLDSALGPLIEFPELKWLRVGLISIGTLARLHLSKLHTMAIDCLQGNDSLPGPPPGTLLLPALKVLQINNVNPTIVCINAPNLDTLYLFISEPGQVDAGNVLKMVFYGGEGMMRPKHLTLHGPVQDMYLITALRFLGENLVCLELDNQILLGQDFWAEMTPSKSTQHGFKASAISTVAGVTGGANANSGAVSTGEEAIIAGVGRTCKQPLLPNLRCLVVNIHKNPMLPGERREMRILLMKLIEGRRLNAQYENLLRLACKWSEDSGAEEMVDPPTCPRCMDAGIISRRPRVFGIPLANAKETHSGSVQPAAGNTRNPDADKDALCQESFAESPENMDVIPAFLDINTGMVGHGSPVTDSVNLSAIATGTEPPDLSGQVHLLDTRPIFTGTYSDVYVGVYGGRKVAVKKLRSLKGPRIMRRKFRRELLIAWSLRHPNLMSLDGYFYGYDDKGEVYYYLVSKWAERGSAAQYIYSDHLTWSERLNLVRDVARGLTYLHSFIVHGDLKPGNVLIDEHGIAQICDFGLSRLLQDHEGTPLNTTTGHTGTVRYLAKELVDTKSAVPSRATDVYALGCVAFEFIYRTPPHFPLDLAWRISSAIHEGRPPATRRMGSEDLLILWDLLECCWSTNPSERPTAQVFFNYLDEAQEAMETALNIIYEDPDEPMHDPYDMDTLY